MFIKLRGVRQHNLKNLNLDIPHYGLIGICGVSGSGKSSLAFHVLHAEGQRRYLETFSPYIRQFFERLNPPDADSIENIPPSIALEGGTTVQNARSTVGTITEINDYLKYLYAYKASPFCPGCNRPFELSTPEDILRYLENERADDRFYILAPWKPFHGIENTKKELIRQGYTRIYHDGRVYNVYDTNDDILSSLAPPLYTVVDRIIWTRTSRNRLLDSISSAFKIGKGKLAIAFPGGEISKFTEELACPFCGFELPEPRPEIFSFNNPIGACPECRGFGRIIGFDVDLVIPDKSKTIRDGAIKPWHSGKIEYYELLSFCEKEGIPTDVPFYRLAPEDQNKIINGTKTFYGIKGYFEWLERKTYKTHVRVFLSKYRAYLPCPECKGTRYNRQAGYFRISGIPIYELQSWSVEKCLEFFKSNRLATDPSETVRILAEEVIKRLESLMELRLGYLTLNRPSRTLSGGEIQRVHLVKVLGSSISNVLYIIDEPGVGLHPYDQENLIKVLKGFIKNRNTVILVDHDPELLKSCDELIELGPKGGRSGGKIVAKGSPHELMSNDRSPTGKYLKNPLPLFSRTNDKRRRIKKSRGCLQIKGAQEFNLKNIDVKIPLGCITGVSGVSGAGKSTLVETTLYANWLLHKGIHTDYKPGKCKEIRGFEKIKEIILVDRKPIARNPRANLLTYSGALGYIRNLLASTDEARAKGFSASFFSFNRPGGRCEVCQGEGYEHMEMQFLSDIYSPCPVCSGKRFKKEILKIRYKGWSIADFLEATASDILSHFRDDSKLRKIFLPFQMLNIHQIELGQPLATLSAGELQRLKLLPLLKDGTGDGRVVILDEPSRGLHPKDTEKLINVFINLVEQGCTIIVVEHNPIVLMACDWIIDLGPYGGDDGGYVVFQGMPEDLMLCERSLTGRHLKKRINASKEHISDLRNSEDYGETSKENVIEIQGLRHHNLKIDSLKIPSNKLTVITGISGSGKSSLAFDVIHAEGQRRYIECLSNYIRQYFTIFDRPEVDTITSLPPTVAIEQRIHRSASKSTVGTITEIYHFLRLLFSRIGVQRCISCGQLVKPLSVDKIVSEIKKLAGKESLKILSPVIYRRKGVYRDLISRLRKSGFSEARIDGIWTNLESVKELSRFDDHTIEIIVPFSGLFNSDDIESIYKAIKLGNGFVIAHSLESGKDHIFSTNLYCLHCGIGYLPLDPRLFSFNSPYGACHRCDGTGIIHTISETRIKKMALRMQNNFFDVWLKAPFIPQRTRKIWKTWLKDSSQPDLEAFLNGNSDIPGLLYVLNKLLEAEKLPEDFLKNLAEEQCPSCKGSRINEQARAVEVGGYTIPQLVSMPVGQLSKLWSEIKVPELQKSVFEQIGQEVQKRINFLLDVGLDYLSLNRAGNTLSGGEMQRIRLAASLGSELCGVLYILDEPTIGLHPIDNRKLIDALKRLKSKGNTVLVVEHDLDTIKAADYLIELGPGGGSMGGRIVASGSFKDVSETPVTSTYRAFSISNSYQPKTRPLNTSRWLTFQNVKFRNLKNITVKIPLNTITCITGVSGSGKSTLLFDVIYHKLSMLFGHKRWFLPDEARCGKVEGAEELSAVHIVDHQPIGRTSRSIPATYLGIWDEIRNIFASLPDARAEGLSASHFSFNVKAGRCSMCSGMGIIVERMSFLPDVSRLCPACRGRRFTSRVLSVRYKGHTISDILDMTFHDVEPLFASYPKLSRIIKLVNQLGLDYIRLGQPSPTLSGGEAQRIKLAKELTKNTKPAIFLLDEPTTGLHLLDIKKLVKVLRMLVEKGHTIVVIEHNMDFVRFCDYVIDLGPGSGQNGGQVIAEGEPEKLAKFEKVSATARILSHMYKGVKQCL